MAGAITLITILFEILNLAILARVLLSWVNISPSHPAVDLLNRITEPILAPLRNLIPPIGMMDVTPIAAMILLEVVRIFLVSLLQSLS